MYQIYGSEHCQLVFLCEIIELLSDSWQCQSLIYTMLDYEDQDNKGICRTLYMWHTQSHLSMHSSHRVLIQHIYSCVKLSLPH